MKGRVKNGTIYRTLRNGFSKNGAEGEYELCFWDREQKRRYWTLVRWRIILDGESGEWHRVHGNQKRDCAGFALLLDRWPGEDS
jgi:hypothetical protein